MDNRLQKQIWQQEHLSLSTLPTQSSENPTSAVVWFVDYLKQNHIPLNGKAVDIGCGKGRNSLYLSKNGFTCYNMDYIEEAIAIAKQRAASVNIANINFIVSEIDSKWAFSDIFFDIAIDSFSSIDIETLSGREVCRRVCLPKMRSNQK